jgi:hypothetical protein
MKDFHNKSVLSVLGALFFFTSGLPGAEPRAKQLFYQLNMTSSAAIKIPADNQSLNSAGGAAGMRARFRDGDVRLYDALPLTPSADYGTISSFSNFCALAKKPQYGAAFSFNRFIHFPVTVRAGTLSPGGSFRRLSSPELPISVSPLAKSFYVKTGLSTALPTASSGEKQPAGFLEIKIPEKCRTVAGTGISFFYREDKTFAGSTVCCVNLPRMIKIGLAVTAGRFFLSNTTASWFSSTNFFSPGWFTAFSCQVFFTSPFFMSLFTTNVYEQPSDKLRLTYRSENKLSLGGFALHLAGFVSDGKDIRCTDNSLLNTLAQLRIIPQYTWRFASPRLPSLSAGAACLVQRRQDRGGEGKYGDIKYAAETRYTDKYISAELSFGTSSIRFMQDQEASAAAAGYTAAARFSHAKAGIRTSASASCTFSENSSEETCTLSLNTTGKCIRTATSLKTSFSQKDRDYEGGTASLVFACTFSSKYLKYTARVTIKTEY